MAKQKDDPMKATHFRTNHAVGPFAGGSLITAEDVHKSFGRDKDATPEEHEAYKASSLKRLLDLGAITPAEAPEEGEEQPAPAAAPAPAPKRQAEESPRPEAPKPEKAEPHQAPHPTHRAEPKK
jgi:hypothetical protein